MNHLELLRARYPHAYTITMQLNGPTLVNGRPVFDPLDLPAPAPRPKADPLLVIAAGWRP